MIPGGRTCSAIVTVDGAQLRSECKDRPLSHSVRVTVHFAARQDIAEQERRRATHGACTSEDINPHAPKIVDFGGSDMTLVLYSQIHFLTAGCLPARLKPLAKNISTV